MPYAAAWPAGALPMRPAFWIAYVLTRPVGASFADYIAFPHSVGGLGAGPGPVALVLTIIIAILVGYLAVTRKDVEDPRQGAASPDSAQHRRAEPWQPGYPPASRPASPPAARPDPPLRYPGRYPDERYPPERYPERRYPQERQPSRTPRQPPEPWPDEDEAEQTAWGFFMWDE